MGESLKKTLVYSLLLMVSVSCASLKKENEKAASGEPLNGQAAVVAPQGTDVAADLAAKAKSAEVIVVDKQPLPIEQKPAVPTPFFKEGVWQKDLMQAVGSKTYEKMSFEFKNAEVHLSRLEKAPRHKKNEPKILGKIEVKLLKGDDHCKFQIKDQEPDFEIIDQAMLLKPSTFSKISGIFKSAKSKVPNVATCEYGVDIKMYETFPVEFNLKKATLFVENWDKPLTVDMSWGSIDLVSVSAINVKCGDCDLTGEKIKGHVQFNLDNGNVGLSGLTSNVEGITYGDTVLKWERLAQDSEVKLVSRAGDVILQFPKGVHLALDLKVPKGEIYSKNEEAAEKKGIPVSITAEAGNVKLYR
jgi:hypothetical protein